MIRCVWAKNEPDITYHDTEWGRPEHEDQRLYEFLVLEGAQAGLSWTTILKRRDGYKKAFANFDPNIVSRYDKRDIARLIKNRGIIRNRLKITSAINNAISFLNVQKEFGSFDRYIWGFVDYKPIKNHFKSHTDIPTQTPISIKLSNDLKKRGFSFVGNTICYALMQAIGMVNDHTRDCYLYKSD